jgi:hypothetical protein
MDQIEDVFTGYLFEARIETKPFELGLGQATSIADIFIAAKAKDLRLSEFYCYF